MRILGGDVKGRRILSPGNDRFRPTSSMVREALFNILPPLSGKTFLDIFAGTGSVGMEALSRDAASAVFVERNKRLSRSLRMNLLRCGFAGMCEVLTMGVEKALPALRKRKATFDILFADPPYEEGMVNETLARLSDGIFFAKEGVLIIQHSCREELKADYTGDLILNDQRKYGDTILSFLEFYK